MNFDCMSIDEIDAFSNLGTADKPADLTVAEFKLLRRYADFKAPAMRKRLEGQIQAALALEATCDKVYQMLPKRLQW